MATHVTRSPGNVFEDFGFAPEEAEGLRIRSALMATIRTVIEQRGMTHARTATLFGMTQPRVSDLVRGKIDLFSIDMLVEMLVRAGARSSWSCSPREFVSGPNRSATRSS